MAVFVPGVVDVISWGGKTKTYDITIDLDRLRDEGWVCPEALPGGLELVAAMETTSRAVHLVFSDGIDIVSLFTQPGLAVETKSDQSPVTAADRGAARVAGAEILRLWVAATDYSGELSISDEILKRTSDAYRKLRNTARFLLSNLDGFDPAQHLLYSYQQNKRHRQRPRQ